MLQLHGTELWRPAPPRWPTGIVVQVVDTQKICDNAHAKYETNMHSDAIGLLIKGQWGVVRKGHRMWLISTRGEGGEITTADDIYRLELFEDFGDEQPFSIIWDGKREEFEGALVSKEPLCVMWINADTVGKLITDRRVPLEQFIEKRGITMQQELPFFQWAATLGDAQANWIFT